VRHPLRNYLHLRGPRTTSYNPQVIIGIDLGAKRIGIAISDSGVLATPHSVLRNEGDVVAKLARLAGDLEADSFVVGIPSRTHATPAEQKFRDFADDLRQRTCKEVVLWNESLSTVQAAEHLRETRRNRRAAEKDIDMYAAAVILQSWLDHARSDDGGGLHRTP
jgi:putative Holliday junction resolvase